MTTDTSSPAYLWNKDRQAERRRKAQQLLEHQIMIQTAAAKWYQHLYNERRKDDQSQSQT